MGFIFLEKKKLSGLGQAHFRFYFSDTDHTDTDIWNTKQIQILVMSLCYTPKARCEFDYGLGHH